MALILRGPCAWWGGTAQAGTWSAGGDEVEPVVAVLGPHGAGPEALLRARARAFPWLGRTDPGLVPLRAVELAALSADPADGDAGSLGRIAWVYADRGLVPLGAIVEGQSRPLPAPFAFHVVARCADVLEPIVAAGAVHPGPSLEDVFVGPDGEVALVGFATPFARPPSRREPHGADDANAAVWRLGLLVLELLVGPTALHTTERGTYDRSVRRALIEAMARPGAPLGERHRDWIAGMLAWDPEARPRFGPIGAALHELAGDGAPDESFAAWCTCEVPAARARGRNAVPWRDPEEDWAPARPFVPVDRTAEVDATEAFADDDTQVTGGERGKTDVRREPGVIPVQVGPPPPAVLPPVRLPHHLVVTDPTTDRPERAPPAPLTVAILVTLVVAACALAVYLSG